jgi:hypothetical protein
MGKYPCSGQLGINGDPVGKITKAKRTRGIAQKVEHLPSKCKTLSSNPSSVTNK